MSYSRRTFLRAVGGSVIVLPLCASGYPAVLSAADTPHLDPADPAASALGYTHAAPNPSKTCSVCQLYKGSRTAEWGRCAIFPGKLVNARGWCSSWSA